MPFGIKNCLYCGELIICKVRRDLDRKKYCSRSCRQLYRYETGQMFWVGEKTAEAMNQPHVWPKKANKGSKHPKFKADRNSLKYPRSSWECKEWEKAVLRHGNYICCKCGETEGTILAHHIKSWRNYSELRFDVDNGEVLCDPCHKKTANYGKGAILNVSI